MAEDSVIEFAPALPAEFRDTRYLPNLLALAGEDAEEQRMTAAKLLGTPRRRPPISSRSELLLTNSSQLSSRGGVVEEFRSMV